MKLTYFFLTCILLLFFLGCRKNSGLAEYNSAVPYYSDIALEHQWSKYVIRGNGNYVTGLKNTSNLILLFSTRVIYAFSMSDGELLWYYQPDFIPGIQGDLEIMETPDKLIFVQKSKEGYVTVLNKVNGAFVEGFSLMDMPGYSGTPASAAKWNDKLYLLSIEQRSPGAFEVNNNVYKFDPLSEELLLIGTEEGYNQTSVNTPILIDSISSKLYVTYKGFENNLYSLNFIEIDLDTDEFSSMRVRGYTTDDLIYSLKTFRDVKIDTLIFTALDRNSGFAAVDSRDGSIIWTTSRQFDYSYTHLGKLFLASLGEFTQVNQLTGKPIWNSGIKAGFSDYVVFHPNKDMALISRVNSNVLRIYDLNDGSVLSEVDARNLGNSTHFPTNALYIENGGKVILATDAFAIHCFKSPFN